jgi:hypothetical protein
MPQTCPVLFLLLTTSVWVAAQATTELPPQTARQALIEMFTGKNPDAFEKHLPEATRHALMHKGDTEQASLLRQFAAACHELSSPEKVLQTFDAGPLLLSVEDRGGQNRIEVTVERDGLMGEEDEIEVSFQLFQKAEVTALPVWPRLIFQMKQEKDIWRVSEATLSLHVPLEEPEYLKTLSKIQNGENEGMAQLRVSALVQLENNYAAKYPERGYTCRLSDLNHAEPDPGQEQPVPVDPAMASEESNGFHFAITGCNEVPATKFHLTGVPIDPDAGMKAFCADNSGKVRFAKDGTAATCWSSGEPLSPEGFRP